MVKTLSYDAILAALAVLSVTGSGCSKTDSVGPAPETTTTAAKAIASPNPATPSPPPQAAPPTTALTVDAGVETRGAAAPKKEPAAACGAGGCSPDMKKK